MARHEWVTVRMSATTNHMAVQEEGPIHCVEQLKIPPGLPDVLKLFTGAAIRAQPNDCLEWSLTSVKLIDRYLGIETRS